MPKNDKYQLVDGNAIGYRKDTEICKLLPGDYFHGGDLPEDQINALLDRGHAIKVLENKAKVAVKKPRIKSTVSGTINGPWKFKAEDLEGKTLGELQTIAIDKLVEIHGEGKVPDKAIVEIGDWTEPAEAVAYMTKNSK